MYLLNNDVVWINVKFFAPVVWRFLFNRSSITGSQTGCRALGHLTACLTPQSLYLSNLGRDSHSNWRCEIIQCKLIIFIITVYTLTVPSVVMIILLNNFHLCLGNNTEKKKLHVLLHILLKKNNMRSCSHIVQSRCHRILSPSCFKGIVAPSFYPVNYILLFSLSLSLSGLLYFFSPSGAITLSPRPSHRLGSKTGAGSWETINHQKHDIKALLQSKWLQTLLRNHWTELKVWWTGIVQQMGLLPPKLFTENRNRVWIKQTFLIQHADDFRVLLFIYMNVSQFQWFINTQWRITSVNISQLCLFLVQLFKIWIKGYKEYPWITANMCWEIVSTQI